MKRKRSLEIKERPSGEGLYSLCPVLRESVTYESLILEDGQRMIYRDDLGISFDDHFVYEIFLKHYDPAVRENRERWMSEIDDGPAIPVIPDADMRPYIAENFFTHADMRAIAGEMETIADAIDMGDIEAIAYDNIRHAMRGTDYEDSEIAAFLRRLCGYVERMLKLDGEEYVTAFWGPA